MTNRTERLNRLDNEVSEQIAELYSSFELAEINEQIIETYKVQKQRELVHAIGDTILGFYQTKDLPNLLVQEVGVTPEVAQKIVADLAEFLAPVLEREAATAAAASDTRKALEQTAAAAPLAPTALQPEVDPNKPPIAVPTVPEPTAEPASAHDVTPMRTMAADMSRVHGYGAYRQAATEPTAENVVRSAPQDELLKERPRLTGVPTVGE